jgi:hypothetical protein
MGVDGGVDSTKQFFDLGILDIMPCIKVHINYTIPQIMQTVPCSYFAHAQTVVMPVVTNSEYQTRDDSCKTRGSSMKAYYSCS